MKVCCKCTVEQDLTCFTKDKRSKDGLCGYCKDCRSILRKNETTKTYNLAYKQVHKAEAAVGRRNYYLQKSQEEKEYARKYRQDNKDKRVYWQNKRKLKIRRASVGDYNDELEKIYLTRPEGHHVDHIVPLQGKTVCGLHVPWNLQYLPAADNMRKSNKYE